MVVTEVFESLKELQGILAEKYSLEQKIEEAPKRLSAQDELLTRMKKEFSETSAEYDEVRAGVEHLRAELAEAEGLRESGEKGMDNITTHREYEVLQKQIDDAKIREDGIRKNLQKEEKRLAELNEKMDGDEQIIKAQEAELSQGKESLEKEVNEYKDKFDELSKKESEITPGIDQEIVYKFQRIIKRNSEGIVAVKNGVCTGCHMILPAQFANEVHEGDKILFCPYCSRILFHQDVEAGEEETFFTNEDTGSLSGFEFDDEDEESQLDGEEREEEDSDEEKPLSFEE